MVSGLYQTVRNIEATGEFVVNFSSEELLEMVNASSAPFEHGDDEAYNNLGVLLWDQGRIDAAEEAFRAGAELGDELAVANLAGLLEERRG